MRPGIVVIIFLAALGAAFGVMGIARAGAPSLRDSVASTVDSFGSKREEHVDPEAFGDAIAAVTDSPQWAALLVTTAVHESGLAARLARGECKTRECDHGKAWGLWQNWKSTHNAASWGSADLTTQAREASYLSRQYYNMCRGSGVPFPLSTMRALGGHGCTMPLRGEAQRMLTYERILRRISLAASANPRR